MIKLTSLVENTSSAPDFKSKHGLCIYIETENHKILFDVGPNELFLENAKKLGVDIGKIDIVVISHGHTDHGGALAKFMEVNKTAKIYIRESAFDKHFTKVIGIPIDVGLDVSLKNSGQIVFTSDNYVVDDELMLFSNVMGHKFCVKSNDKLYAKKNGKIAPDAFEHEQFLVITDGSKQVMITGCSHKGIVNIVEKYAEINGGNTDRLSCVVGGFHLFNPVSRKYESRELIKEIAEYLGRLNLKFYTCHCTGTKAYEIMKKSMGEYLEYFSVGKQIVESEVSMSKCFPLFRRFND